MCARLLGLQYAVDVGEIVVKRQVEGTWSLEELTRAWSAEECEAVTASKEVGRFRLATRPLSFDAAVWHAERFRGTPSILLLATRPETLPASLVCFDTVGPELVCVEAGEALHSGRHHFLTRDRLDYQALAIDLEVVSTSSGQLWPVSPLYRKLAGSRPPAPPAPLPSVLEAFDTLLARLECADFPEVVARLRADAVIPEVQAAGCRALVRCSTDPCPPYLALEAVSGVVRALRTHARSADVVEAACSALTALPESTETGTVDEVIAAAEMHATVPAVVCAACHVVAKRATPDSLAAAPQTTQCVVRWMATHRDVLLVQRAASKAIAAIAAVDSRSAGDAGAVECVLNALRSHGRLVVAEAGEAVERLTAKCTANQERVLALGGVELLVSLSQLGKKHTETVRHEAALACRALCAVMARNADLKAQVSAAGGLAMATALLWADPDSPLVQEAACSALACLATDSGLRDEAGSAVGCIVLAMKTHCAKDKVQVAASQAIRALCECFPANQARFAQCGCADALVASMRAHRAVIAVQLYACGAIVALCVQCPANQAKLAAAGAIDCILKTLQAKTPHPGMQHQAGLALTELLHLGNVSQQAFYERRFGRTGLRTTWWPSPPSPVGRVQVRAERQYPCADGLRHSASSIDMRSQASARPKLSASQASHASRSASPDSPRRAEGEGLGLLRPGEGAGGARVAALCIAVGQDAGACRRRTSRERSVPRR